MSDHPDVYTMYEVGERITDNRALAILWEESSTQKQRRSVVGRVVDPTPATPPTPTDVVDEPGIGAVVRDLDGDLWHHFETEVWVRENEPEDRLDWDDLYQQWGPLTLVTPATPPAATVGEGEVEALARVLAHDHDPADCWEAYVGTARAVLAAGPWPRSTSLRDIDTVGDL